MKLVDTNIITKAEGVFYNAMSSVMDLATIGGLFRKHYNLRLSGKAEFQDLDIVIHNGQIAFKFDYTALGYFSIYMDRYGLFLQMEENADKPVDEPNDTDPADCLVKASIIRERETQLAQAIADAIERETLARLIEVKNHVKLHDRLDYLGARFAVHQDQVVYNLIYQGEIALSFLLDEKGRFLGIAEAQTDSNDAENEPKLSNLKDNADIDDFIVADEQEEVELQELNDEDLVELTDDEDLQALDKMIIDILEEPEQKSTSN
jgi:hypothetical protein